MDRLKSIIKILLERKEPVTTNEIARLLHVSNKTVRNDLLSLQDMVEREGLRLNKKPGVGTEIEGPEENKLQLLQSIKENLNYIEPYSPEGRHNYILKRLFMRGGSVTSQELADELYVCVATIHKDLEQIEDWLQKFNLQMMKKRNYGVEIVGKEADYRKAISSLISQTKEVEELQELLHAEYKGRIDYHSMVQLKSLLNIDYRKLEELLNQLENKLKFRFSQEAYITLIIHIAITMKRIQEEKDIILSKEILESIKNTEEFICGKEMGRQMEESFGVIIPESEIGYITLHILGSKMHERDLGALTFSFEQVGELETAVEIAKSITKVAGDALAMDLSKDQRLLNGLILHLRPTLNRLKYGLTLRNPILEDIKINYPDIFGVAWICSKVFEKYLDVKIPESEIGYIALHLGAAVERNRKLIKTLVVCHSGIGTSQLLSARLQRCFKEIEIMGIASSTALNQEILENAELVISTVPLQIDQPILMISPLLVQNDIQKIDNFIYTHSKLSGDKGTKTQGVGKEVFLRSKRFENYEQLIREMCSSLEKKQYIKKDFIHSVLHREKIMATEIGNGIAIPHGDPSEVKNSCIALTVLEHPLKWKTEIVKSVFLICFSEKDLTKTKFIIRNLYEKMDNQEFLQGLTKGPKEIAKLLEGLLDT